ncbi:MAG: type I glyceraldehyde-3-phosphate dehydrogenase [Candidatus Caldipriscus sp.]|nr:type I glyceraldehyde-3-phosphate dehydrogenase [Candidatus Caldipriscus sp.]
MGIAINGFGRIGRQVFKILYERGIFVDYINDITDAKTLAHLLKYDSVYGKFNADVSFSESEIRVNGRSVKVLSEPDISKISWKDLGVDMVIESSGKFTEYEKAYKHIEVGARNVIITAPVKGKADITVVYGINHTKIDKEKHKIISAASCTTNAFALMVKVLHENFGISKGLMSTVHGYTNDQRLHDAPHKDLRRARNALLNIVPTSTGAAKTIFEIYPELKGKLDAIALRVPVAVPSLIDFSVELEREVSVDEINQAFIKASEGELKGLLGYTNEDLVSSDFIGDKRTVIIDLPLTKKVENYYKVFGWYDNEWGYSERVADIVSYLLR